MSIPVLGYWDIRGLVEPIRFLLHYCGVEFHDKRYQYGADGSRQQWLNDKDKLGLDFPNLPYYIDGDLKLTQSLVILRHLARKHNLVGVNENDQVRIELAEQQISDLRSGLSSICYNQAGNFEKLREEYVRKLPSLIGAIAKFFGENQYIAGDYITYVDFLLYDVLDYQRLFEPTALNGFANLNQFMERIEKIPAISKYLTGGVFHRLPYCGYIAKWGNKRE